ncbi:hyaluronidase-1 [Monodelphis domestica]|uniref:hyaluronidase-1 n=1 Tax=Monodelphis domestica TaxID=13616 RepID=UPI0024E228F6|nr:hyaluronidase-1 [Monodelphis domestica]XP_056661014.1 hyaluronidase-1 [Monodelphis domestica]
MASGDFKPSICVLLLILVDLTQGSGGPVLPNIPFVVVWNANTYLCEENFQVNISLDAFHVVANPSQAFRGPNMTIFYRPNLGIYPWYTEAEQPINGGLPQNASLQDHLAKSSKDILATLPESDFHGIVVIDWEEWRPIWKTNWDTKKIYKHQSLALVREEHPEWSPSQVKETAKKQFEEAAKEWMVETLNLGKLLQPRGLWGYYGFPDCYNYNFQKPNYTGECLPEIRHLNDKLSWMWEQSRALYPSIYLHLELEETGKSLLYVRSRLQEAFRVAQKTQNPGPSILPYGQIFYALTDSFLPLEELENTIGESAAQGTDGIVMWLSESHELSKESCQDIKDYVDTILGPFVLNVTSSAYICSEALCSGHGRCARRQHYPHAFLFLEDSFSIYRQPGSGHLRLQGFLEEKSLEKMKTQFECRCYTGWTGKHCAHLESQ